MKSDYRCFDCEYCKRKFHTYKAYSDHITRAHEKEQLNDVLHQDTIEAF